MNDTQKGIQLNFFDNSELVEVLVDSILSEFKREGVDPQEFLMRLLVRDFSAKLGKLPKRLQQAAIALLVDEFLGKDESSDLVRG